MTNDDERSTNERADQPGGDPSSSTARKRRRGSRGGQRRRKGRASGSPDGGSAEGGNEPSPNGSSSSNGSARAGGASRRTADTSGGDPNDIELPESMREGRASPEAAERALVRKPKIGDTLPAPSPTAKEEAAGDGRKSKGKGRGRGPKQGSGGDGATEDSASSSRGEGGRRSKRGRAGSNRGGRARTPKRRRSSDELSADAIEQRRGRERNGKPIGRYMMCVQVRPGMAQVAVLEGRSLIEHYVSRPSDDVSQIHGNIYLGKVQNVLPGMEAAFVDIATPKNAVLYRNDVQYDAEDIEEVGERPRIEDILKAKQHIVCQVTKNPIGHKGARLTQEVSLPGRFVVLIPNSKTYGISKRLPDDVRKRLRNILDRIKPEEHGLIVRTAAEHATETELTADVTLLLERWEEIERKAAKTQRASLLYREPELAVRRIREEFNTDYRGVVIDDRELYEEIREYVAAFNPELADRIEYFDHEAEGLSLFERYHVHEQVHKALDRKVWLPSGGSLIIEHTEALTVIDVNTGKNVGTSNLEETVFHNNLEAAEEIAKQLRLRDIGGIIVIDFIDMEIKGNRQQVIEKFRSALARDKTRSQVFDISELGLVEMTRKRIGEGLLTEFSEICPDCEGRGVHVDYSLLD